MNSDKPPLNLLGQPLVLCCADPVTGFFRDGFCKTNALDQGSHVICAQMTHDFLAFTQSRGNNLSTPRAEFDFPGLKPGDRWCLCALRWREAYEAGVAPPVYPESTQEKALEFLERGALRQHYVH
ncbi:MAG: DUF2237 domain-containing protein [Hydrogenovibrio sp.]|uniref:DUF2237 family protein n=1 Tax=Hydrogenovibrio sp. TaxID=2065821 RepID=UPI00287007D8|nr:DUF2237 domain-containing protein [Hydrogenovibrio sp.]MDR9499919.1 DUF2237 domain-containing protein [Hydrogenovibrio sp.]